MREAASEAQAPGRDPGASLLLCIVDPRSESTRTAAGLMASFAERTGLNADRAPRRYLWTDAFAVCNFLALERRTGDARWRELALRLIDQVHAVLGRHRPDEPRRGWLSGLSEQEGSEHPTRGGLRIGKPLPERQPGEPFDERLEWERDGQYFHYSTKWTHALDQASSATGDPRLRLWAKELAEAAYEGFVRGPPGSRRMAWKMSIDLSRPLVSSTGQHDPLDGFLTCLQLETPAGRPASAGKGPSLVRPIAEFAALLATSDLSTDDPLGLGGLLADSARLAQLLERGRVEWSILLESLLAAADAGLVRFANRRDLALPASRRLAFRELGLALGCSAIDLLRERVQEDAQGVFQRPEMHRWIEALLPKAALGPAIVSFWLAREHRLVESWTDHLDIDEVMLATCLVPEGFLVLRG